MSHPRYSSEEIARRGREIYDCKIKSQLEPHRNGSFVVIDIETEEFEVDDNKLAAADRLRARRPDSALYLACVGRPTAITLGSASAQAAT